MDAGPSQISLIIQFITIAILILINAYFAASEMAIVSVNKTKIHHLAEEGNRKAQLVERLLQEPTGFLSTIQVAITLAGFFNSASAATGVARELGVFLERFNVPFGESIAMVVVTILLSFVTLILGELVPKRIALQKAEKLAMSVAGPIVFISKIVSPFIKLLSWSTAFVLRIAGIKDENIEESLSREEIRSMVISGQEKGVFNETETEMINSIFEFDDTQAEAVMTPRTEAFCIDIDDPLESYMDELMEMHYTRIPVYQDSIDNIIGILHMKDFTVQARIHGFDKVDIKSILRKPYFALESKKVDELFISLQREHQHIAILVDEYGGFSGLVTLEDLIEEIVGEIADEYDDGEDPVIKKIDDHTYILDGSMDIDDIDEELHLQIPMDDLDTLSGFLIDQLGELPQEGEKKLVKWENLTFKIEEFKDKRVGRVKLYIDPEPIKEEAAE